MLNKNNLYGQGGVIPSFDGTEKAKFAYEELNVYIYPLLLITFSIWIAMQGESSIAGISLFLSFVWYFWLIL